MRRLSKIEKLRQMGWSKNDLLELFQEVADIVFSSNHQICQKTKKEVINDFFLDLGFRLTDGGSIILKKMLIHCLDDNNPDLNFKRELYPPIIEETGLEYETIRSRAREALYDTFKYPTELGKTIFSRSIQKKGYPTIKEFILESYDYLKRILPEDG